LAIACEAPEVYEHWELRDALCRPACAPCEPYGMSPRAWSAIPVVPSVLPGRGLQLADDYDKAVKVVTCDGGQGEDHEMPGRVCPERQENKEGEGELFAPPFA